MQINFRNLNLSKEEYQMLLEYARGIKSVRNILSELYAKYGDKVTFGEINKYNRYDSFEENIIAEIKKLSGISLKKTNGILKDVYSRTYTSSAESIDRATKTNLGFYEINPDVLKEIVKNPLDKVTWQFRNAANHENIIPQVRSELAQSFIQQKGYVATAIDIKVKFDNLANNTLRIVRTESHRVYNTAMNDQISKVQKSGKRLGLEVRKVWDANNSKDPRPNHSEMDGQVADENGLFRMITIEGNEILVAAPGNTGVASEDINCHCLLRTEIIGL